MAVEFSLARVRPTQLDEWDSAGRAGAGAVRHGVEHIDAYLAACQLGITLASLGLGVVGEPVFARLLEPVLGDSASIAGFGLAAVLAFSLITMLHVVIGELSPKSLAIARTESTALLVAPPMRIFYLATKPVVDLFNGMGNLLLKPFGIPPASEAGHAPHSEEELHSLVRESSEHGVLERDERRLAENALAFDERRVREVMRPRTDVATVRAGDSRDDVLECARQSGYTRFPLVEEDAGGLDAALGVVHLKDVVLAQDATDLRECARHAPRVPDAAVLSEVLGELQGLNQHMAIVIDEHGTAVGIVTVEDLVEELVGEIRDEHDPDMGDLIRQEGAATIVDGRAPLGELMDRLDMTFDDPRETTIGGLVVERLGRVPDAGETIEVDGFCAEVLAVGGGRLRRLRLVPRPDPE